MTRIPIPQWASRKHRAYQRGLDAGLTPVCLADDLLRASHRQAIVRGIEQLVRLSPAHFEALYRPVISHFAGFAQQLPAGNAGPAGLLDHGLALALTALKLRRTQLLPEGEVPEVIKHQTDLWSYATLTAALLHGIARLGVDQEVALFDKTHRALGLWNPWVGPMPEAAHWYRMRLRRVRLDTRYNLTALLQAPLIVPEAGLTWLTENTDVFPLWLAAVAGDLDSAGALGGFITQAEARCAGADGFDASSVPVCVRDDERPAGAESAPVGDAHEKAVNLAPAPATSERLSETSAQDTGEAFLQWLVAELNAGHVDINTPTAHVYRVREGLLLVGVALFRRYAREKEVSLKLLKQQFLELGVHRRSIQNADILTYSVPRERNRGKLTVKGLVIAEPEKLGLTLPDVDEQLMLSDALQEAS